MEKIGFLLVVSISLIILGMVIIFLGNQVILEDVIQGSDMVNLEKELIITSNLDSEKYSKGVYAIQIPELDDKSFILKVMDPSNNQIISRSIEQEKIQEEFDVNFSGDYKLIVSSNSENGIQVFAAIGPLPDASKTSLSIIAFLILGVGLILLLISTILKIKMRKSI